MHFISHRGNLDGRVAERENHPDFVREALAAGFQVSVDVHWHEGGLWLGTESPIHRLNHASWLENPKIWCRAGTLETLDALLVNGRIHCFAHDNNDAMVLTSRQFIWNMGAEQSVRSICVRPEVSGVKEFRCAGVCSDFVRKIRSGDW